MKWLDIACLLLLMGMTASHAAATLFDFEQDSDVTAWKIRAAGQDTLARSPRFATCGASSLQFHTPVWQKGMQEWPAFETKPGVSDWRPYDRLVIDITNPDAERHFFSLFVCDSKVALQDGLGFAFELPSRGFKRYIVPLSTFPDKVNRADITLIHFFTQRPVSDMTLYLDGLTLLQPGEAEPPIAPGFVNQVAALTGVNLDAFERNIAERRATLLAAAKTPERQRSAEARTGELSQAVKAARQEMNAPAMTVARLEKVQSMLAVLPGKLERLDSIARFEADFDALGLGSPNALVGQATSAEKVLPRDAPFQMGVSRNVRVRLARNEKESVQVVVTPRVGDLKQVAVSVSDLKSPSGAVFSAKNVNCDVMGYVQTKQRPPYDVSYVGWWPDPILDFLGPVDIKSGDLQSFWVRFRAPKDQPAGTYKGKLQVTAAGQAPVTLDLTVRVFDFTLPDHMPLPTAITFFEQKPQMGGEANWAKMKLQYADFLADYYMNYDSLYRQGPPDFEIIKHVHDRGQLVAFNLGNILNGGGKEEELDAAMAKLIAELKPGYEKAKELGILDHAYLYGFDECPEAQFKLLERSAQALKKAFPGVLLMTTSYDHTFGLDSVVKTIDAWCPLTPSFKGELAAQAREKGRKVWWYICCGPHHPFANWFVEYPALDARLLMGAMVARERPDGFLYYSLTIWNDNKPIEKGPFTDWNPVSWTNYHGDGSLFCAGPGGKPVPTIRLENYRDGLEDYAYVLILEDTIRQVEARKALTVEQRKWLTEAKAAIEVPEGVVKNMARYTHSPATLYQWRNKVAELIEASGVKDANPWGKEFGVRGELAGRK